MTRQHPPTQLYLLLSALRRRGVTWSVLDGGDSWHLVLCREKDSTPLTGKAVKRLRPWVVDLVRAWMSPRN